MKWITIFRRVVVYVQIDLSIFQFLLSYVIEKKPVDYKLSNFYLKGAKQQPLLIYLSVSPFERPSAMAQKPKYRKKNTTNWIFIFRQNMTSSHHFVRMSISLFACPSVRYADCPFFTYKTFWFLSWYILNCFVFVSSRPQKYLWK